jgi:hypothetical protein
VTLTVLTGAGPSRGGGAGAGALFSPLGEIKNVGGAGEAAAGVGLDEGAAATTTGRGF